MSMVNKRSIKTCKYLITTPFYRFYDITIGQSFFSDSNFSAILNEVSEEKNIH